MSEFGQEESLLSEFDHSKPVTNQPENGGLLIGSFNDPQKY